MPIRFPKQGNPYYPLPPDYPTLSPEGQRKARINALMLRKEPEDLVYAWDLFRTYYLKPKSARWYKKWLPSPPMHFMIPYDMSKYSRNVWAATRSFAKTTVIRELCMMLALTSPADPFAVSLVQATEKKVRKSMTSLKRQLTYNPLIQDDFSKLFGEPIIPKRGVRTWSDYFIELPNGSTIEAASVNGALRGDRPDLIAVDDPEYDDEDDGTDPDKSGKLIQDWERLLFNVILGMLDDGAGIFWIGTLISRRHFIYQMVNGHDPRVGYWNRKILDAEERNADGSLLWEAKWDEQTLRDKRLSMGESAYNAEMRNKPGAPSDRIFKTHPELSFYEVVDGSPHQEPRPLDSHATLVFHHAVKQEAGKVTPVATREKFGEWASRLFRMMTVDVAHTQKATSDYSAICVLGFDHEDVLWVLDLWLGKVGSDTLVRNIWDKAVQWRPRVIGVEDVTVQKYLADRVASDLSRMLSGTGYSPFFKPPKYPGKTSKGTRIAGLEWRFNQFRIKFPGHRKLDPAFTQLLYQVDNFTPDLSMLKHDDAIDALAMHQFMMRRQGRTRDRGPLIKTPAELLREGKTIDEDTGISLISGLNADEVPMEVWRDLRMRKYDELGYERGEEVLDPWKSSPGPFVVL